MRYPNNRHTGCYDNSAGVDKMDPSLCFNRGEHNFPSTPGGPIATVDYNSQVCANQALSPVPSQGGGLNSHPELMCRFEALGPRPTLGALPPAP